LAQVCFHSVFIRLLDFLIYLVITLNAVFFLVKIFLCSSLLRKRCVFIRLLSLSPVCLFRVCWVRGNFLAVRVIYFLCVCLRCVECRAGTILFRLSVGADGGTVQIFFMSGSVVAGTVRLKWWGRVVRLFVLSLVCCQFSWRLDVCGRIFSVMYFDFLW
jgi:hypothetical protein